MNTIKISDLLTIREMLDLKKTVKARRGKITVHNCVMNWLDSKPLVMEKFRTHSVLKAFGSYLFEYHLKLK